MPSLLENSPYAVAECIEHGVPFLAADVGGTPELVAAEDRARVLHPPTPDDFAAALERRPHERDGVEPARPARAPEDSLAAWLELVETVEPYAAAVPDRVACRPRASVRAQRSDDVVERVEWLLLGRAHRRRRRAGRRARRRARRGAGGVRRRRRHDGGATGGRRGRSGSSSAIPGALGLVENQYGVARPRPAVAATDDVVRLALSSRALLCAAERGSSRSPTPLAVHLGAPRRADGAAGRAARLRERAGSRRCRDSCRSCLRRSPLRSRARRPTAPPTRRRRGRLHTASAAGSSR